MARTSGGATRAPASGSSRKRKARTWEQPVESDDHDDSSDEFQGIASAQGATVRSASNEPDSDDDVDAPRAAQWEDSEAEMDADELEGSASEEELVRVLVRRDAVY